ncbi:sigma 54-interacting transcriptional regulator [Lysinibacillus macroides]|uniref:Transcriptional regulator n=1 Tax=Lysinibacillus macroides TaxID=33935 RepID=A0A0M9DJU6_9BACI|nr:helix-turn-helix domain-containing protein [Lysinibacillus macroides]KOY82339.1 transcriptional regulator [Lysinibacillus macroides]QPR66622.1 sigma 54-interacting transcriptional regulator [Lysinibacillus macroides]
MDNSILLSIYRYVIEKGDMGICVVDTDGKLLIYNKKMRELEGVNEDEFEERRALEIIDFETEKSDIYKVLNSETPVLNVKKTYWNKKNQEVTYISNIYPLHYEGVLVGAVEFARDITQLEYMMYQPLRRYGAPLTFDIISAVSAVMKDVIEKAKIVALSRMPVVLIGESGTGIDMIAEGIHHDLSVKNDMFIALICRRDEDTILKHFEKYIVEKEKITFFAERIEYLSMAAQEKIVELFNNHPNHHHMLIASVGKDPIDLIQAQKLSKKLYRLFSGITIYVPPLRERKEDIMPFIDDYFKRHRDSFGSSIQGLSEEVQEIFLGYDWPGNLKELEVLLDEISSLLTNETVVDSHMLPAHFRWKIQYSYENGTEEKADLFIIKNPHDIRPLDVYMKEVEEYYISKALDFHQGNISKTAAALGIRRQSLQYRVKNYKLNKKSENID